MIYSNSTGTYICEGVADMRKADGYVTNYAPKIVFDEEGALVGVQGGELSLEKSFGLIENLKTQHKEEVLRKAQKKSETLKKSFSPSATLPRTRTQQIAASMDNKAGFTKLLAELDLMKSNQEKIMTKAWRS